MNTRMSLSGVGASSPAGRPPVEPRSPAPLAYSIPQVCKLTGLGRTTIYAAIKCHHLIARRYGRRTVVLEQDLRRFLDGLPSF
jgi:excisionase family DNA binding protein